MKKQDLVNALYEKGLVETKKQSKEIVNYMLDKIKDELANGGDVCLAGFGKFTTSVRAVGGGIIPNTNTKIERKKVNVVKFKSHKSLKDMVQ